MEALLSGCQNTANFCQKANDEREMELQKCGFWVNWACNVVLHFVLMSIFLFFFWLFFFFFFLKNLKELGKK